MKTISNILKNRRVSLNSESVALREVKSLSEKWSKQDFENEINEMVPSHSLTFENFIIAKYTYLYFVCLYIQHLNKKGITAQELLRLASQSANEFLRKNAYLQLLYTNIPEDKIEGLHERTATPVVKITGTSKKGRPIRLMEDGRQLKECVFEMVREHSTMKPIELKVIIAGKFNISENYANTLIYSCRKVDNEKV